MDSQKKQERISRVQDLSKIIENLYPSAEIELDYTTHFECLVAVMLSAQCTDKRVNMVTVELFAKYKTIQEYAKASQQEMEKDVFSCGFYRMKAKNIIAAANMVLTTFNGEIPKTIEECGIIPGVARKTANVVLATLYGIQEGIAVDTHIRRFAIRFDLSDYTDPKRIEKDLMEIVPNSLWWGFTHKLVHYGRHTCKAHKHDCAQHPLTTVYPRANEIWPKSH